MIFKLNNRVFTTNSAMYHSTEYIFILYQAYKLKAFAINRLS